MQIMQTVAGVFQSAKEARRAASELLLSGFSRDQVSLLLPGASEEQIHSVPTSETEQPGMGKAMGGVVGGSLGAATGFELGVYATALIPGVGPVISAGIAGAALLGAGGLIAGMELGAAGEKKSTEGVPADEIFFYEDALRQGRSVVILLARSDEEKHRAQHLLASMDAESIDAARDAWWIGLRDAEAEHYRALGHNFEQDHDIYRAGFEAALRRECRGRTVEDAADCLKWWHPNTWDSEAFRRGFARGRAYLESRQAGSAVQV
jgi:hypothetical protein